MDWGSYTVGGATRPDAISGLDPMFRAALGDMLLAAAGEGLDLKITSAYRSPEVQAGLWESALAKYGSPEAARKWVAPPGKSQHNFGRAADFAGPGGLLRDANSPEARWIAANAERFGLAVPMEWEPWQVELAGSRDGAPRNALSPQQGQVDQMQQFNALMAMRPRYEAPQINAFRIEAV